MEIALFVLLLAVSLSVVWLITTNMMANGLLQRRPPDPPDPPDRYGLAYEEVHFRSRDGLNLAGWWILHEQAIGTIVMCHGQNGSMDGDTHYVPPLYAAGFNVLMFDSRAHGRSEGQYVTFGMYEKEDLLGALDYLAGRGIERVGVLGFSMGAATALITAALSERICAIVADGSFGRLKRTLTGYLRQRGLPGLIARPLVQWAVSIASVRTEGRLDQTDPIRWTPHIGPRPILFIQGEDDPFVSMQDLDRMASLAQGPVEIWIVPDAGHREAARRYPDEYNRRVIAFFTQHLREEKPAEAAVQSRER